jgi:hypothetical protein
MKMKRRVERLERAVPPQPPDETLQLKRWAKVLDRFVRLVEQAATLVSPDEEQRVAQALGDLIDGNGRRGPYAGWLRDLQDGWCRLPNLPPATMKDLLVAWSSPGVSGGVVCQSCGLEYPHQNYRPLLPACPGCASREWDWAHLVRDYDRAWKGLDGYVGGQSIEGVS